MDRLKEPIKILHIDPEYQVTYFVCRPGSLCRSPVSIEEAVNLLTLVEFDLILSEPHNRAILTRQDPERV